MPASGMAADPPTARASVGATRTPGSRASTRSITKRSFMTRRVWDSSNSLLPPDESALENRQIASATPLCANYEKTLMATVDSERAFEFMYELFKAKPWLNSAGVMSQADHHAEDEAVAFLLTVETAHGWGSCSEAACRVANSLLLDFVAKLHSQFVQSTWEIPPGLPNPA